MKKKSAAYLKLSSETQKTRDMLSSMPMDVRGHLRGGLLPHDQEFLRHILGNALPLRGEDVDNGWEKIPMATFECTMCGSHLDFWTDGSVARVRAVIFKDWPRHDDCPYESGPPDMVFRIPILSGKMVVANDLRDLFPVEEKWRVNHYPGSLAVTEAYAALGMAHAFVCNTNPGVYQVSSSEFLIGQGDEEGSLSGHPEVASVCTDLWWYSICDYDEYMKRATPEFLKEAEEFQLVQVVSCTPGVYEFRHRFWSLSEEEQECGVYTQVQRV